MYVQRGPFGTFEDPVPILSNFNNRVVGCLGMLPHLYPDITYRDTMFVR